MDITFRPITDRDMPFLQELYGTTREDELALVDWSREEKDDFIARKRNGFVRECHGDMHLGNMILRPEVDRVKKTVKSDV